MLDLSVIRSPLPVPVFLPFGGFNSSLCAGEAWLPVKFVIFEFIGIGVNLFKDFDEHKENKNDISNETP